MFPLGSVLFPHMPLGLRVFEERYLVMLAAVLDADTPEFGVVLIERGQEVGGGEQRFPHGTRASVGQVSAEASFVGLVAVGGERFEVVEWLEEEPYPRAIVKSVPPLFWSEESGELLDEAERAVRRSLSLASEFADGAYPANVELSDDPLERAWQLAGIAPLGELDQMVLLRSGSVRGLLRSVIELVGDAEQTLTWPD